MKEPPFFSLGLGYLGTKDLVGLGPVLILPLMVYYQRLKGLTILHSVSSSVK